MGGYRFDLNIKANNGVKLSNVDVEFSSSGERIAEQIDIFCKGRIDISSFYLITSLHKISNIVCKDFITDAPVDNKRDGKREISLSHLLCEDIILDFRGSCEASFGLEINGKNIDKIIIENAHNIDTCNSVLILSDKAGFRELTLGNGNEIELMNSKLELETECGVIPSITVVDIIAKNV